MKGLGSKKDRHPLCRGTSPPRNSGIPRKSKGSTNRGSTTVLTQSHPAFVRSSGRRRSIVLCTVSSLRVTGTLWQLKKRDIKELVFVATHLVELTLIIHLILRPSSYPSPLTPARCPPCHPRISYVLSWVSLW